MDESDRLKIEKAEQEQAQRTMVLKIALDVLSYRTLTLIAMLLNAGVAIWCMLYPDALRAVTALLFAVTTWCLINIRHRQGE